MGCPLRVQVGALYGSRAWQWPLQQAPLVVGLLLPVRALARRVSEGSGLDRSETRPVELVGRGQVVSVIRWRWVRSRVGVSEEVRYVM